MRYLLASILLIGYVLDTTAQVKQDTTAWVVAKMSLTKYAAQQIAEAAEKEAAKNNWAVSIAVMNEAGQLMYFIKMDKSSNASGDAAIAKAKHTAYYKRDTKFHQELLLKGNNLVLALPNALPIEGGLQLFYQGTLVGSIGVAGAASEDDGKIAKRGAEVLSR